MLHAVAQLAEHGLRHIRRALGNEVHANTLGTNQPYHLLYFFQQCLGCLIEQQVCFIEKEHQLRFIEITYFRQRFE